MARLVLPDSRFRSPTALAGKSDLRDEQLYSALVMADAGAGMQKVFTVPQGQTVPILGGANSLPQAHQKTYSPLSTNLSKAGELGSGLGDASIRAIGITVEQATPIYTTNVQTAYGAGVHELREIQSKSTFLLRVGSKKQIEGPTWAFPAMGGIGTGAVVAAGATLAVTTGFGTNGDLSHLGRRLKLPIMIARTDTIEGEVAVPLGALAFSITASPAQPTLVWYTLLSLIKGDVRTGALTTILAGLMAARYFFGLF